jgi:RNA polymerase sigma factor (TIGR02999 family)
MALASRQRWQPSGASASLFPAAGANCAPALLSSLRVAHVTVAGNADPSSDLFTDLYAQLRQIAQSALRRSGPLLTVSPTTLLHEAYLKISDRDALAFPDRARFMAYASRAMRRLVIDFVRERRALKRGAAFEITSLPTEAGEVAGDSLDLQRISDALDELATVNATLAELVDLHFFCGFSFAEIAALLDLSERTVMRDWNKARLYLHDVLREP